jgi:hypothetical protein
MKPAQIGPYQPKEENLDEIIKAAEADGEVVVYADTSTGSKNCKDFDEHMELNLLPQISVQWI